MMLIMRQIAHATRAMSRFECKKVLNYLQDIPDKYQDHYYVILLKATAYFEINSFAKVRIDKMQKTWYLFSLFGLFLS